MTVALKQRSVGTGTICWETLALEEEEAVGSRVGLRLGHQAGFANPGFAGKQDDLPLATFGSLKEEVEGSEFGAPTNDDGANAWEIDWNLHDFCLCPAFLCERLSPPGPIRPTDEIDYVKLSIGFTS